MAEKYIQASLVMVDHKECASLQDQSDAKVLGPNAQTEITYAYILGSLDSLPRIGPDTTWSGLWLLELSFSKNPY